MNRLIDADELERAVMSLGEDVVCDDCAYEFVNLIDAQPTIEAEPVHWINMDEDEPPLGQKVLVYRAKKPVEIMSMLYMDNEYWWRNNADEIFKAYDNDYWMPLPELPKEVSE